MAKIQLKRLTSGTIENSAVVLAAGEPCLAKDADGKQYIVFGDGSTPIKDLTWEPIGDAASVKIDDLTIVENASNELEVQLSADAGNALEVKTDGLFVETVDQVKVSTKNLLPATGAEKTLYVVSDEKHIYYWDGTDYVQLTQDFAGLVYKGSLNTSTDLPTTGMKNGDFWWIVDEDKFKIWNGTTWDTIELAQDQADMAETVTTSTTFIKNKKAEYITYVPLTGGSLTKTNVQEALEEVDAALKKKQDKVPTAVENNYASWDNAGQTKDSGDSKTTTIAPLDSASDNKLPSERAVAKVKQDLEDILNSQETSNTADLGDKAILPLLLDAHGEYNLVNSHPDFATFTDKYSGGYFLTGNQSAYLHKTFNRIKLFILTPGWVRVGIVRGTAKDELDGVARGCFKAGSTLDSADTYPTTLVDSADDSTADGGSHTVLKKWLVCQWVATPGYHEWDIPDEKIDSPLEYVYYEARMGISGWAMNRNTAAATVNGITVPANTSVSGVSFPTSFVTTTNFNNGSYAVSNNMLDASARPMYSTAAQFGQVYNAFNAFSSASTTNPNKAIGADVTWLNIGLYQRGTAGNTYLQPVVENCISQSLTRPNTTNALAGYGPSYEDQQVLAERGTPIYGVELVVITPGDLTAYVFSSNDPAKNKIVKAFTLRTRAVGKQLIRLPEEVILQPGQWMGFVGLTEATIKTKPAAATYASGTTINKGYTDTCVFAHNLPTVSNWTMKGDDPTGVQSILPYSSASENYSSEFIYWDGVTYNPTTGKVDFSSATLQHRPSGYLNISLVCRTNARSKLEGMNYSVTGDSITTYRGQISQSNDFGVTTNAAGNNAIFYPDAGSGYTNSIDTTWWGLLGKECRMRLIKNDAWSGSQVGGTDSTTNSTACASSIRCNMLRSNCLPAVANTTAGLGTPYGMPDVIFCMIGTNDLASNRAAGAWSNTAPTNISTIIGAFETMVARHRIAHPETKLVYFLIPRGNSLPYPYTNANGLSIAQLAQEMEYTAQNMGAYFVPLSYFSSLNCLRQPAVSDIWTPTAGYSTPRSVISTTTTVDYLHPTALGHQYIADGLRRFCEEKF